MCAAADGMARLVRELLVHDADLDARLYRHAALCMATMNCHTDAMNVLLEEYQARGRLREALNRPCLDADGYPSSLLQHLTTARLGSPAFYNARAGVKVGRRCPRGPHRDTGILSCASCVSLKGILPLVKYFIEECGLSVDEPTPGGHCTPLTFACAHKEPEPVSEAVLVPNIYWKMVRTRHARRGRGTRRRRLPPSRIGQSPQAPGLT